MRTINIILVVTIVFVVQNVFAAETQCLKYEPATVELSGTIKKVVFPGPPNYESVEEGDRPETYWILYLEFPICVEGNQRDDLNVAEHHIEKLQLIVNDYEKNLRYLNRKAMVRGKLMHAISGHHHTSVLLIVEDMRNASIESLQSPYDCAKGGIIK